MSQIYTKEQIEYLKKYSFLDDVQIEGIYMKFFYHVKEKQKMARIARRAGHKQLTALLRKIEKQTGATAYGKGKNSDYFII